MDAFQKVKGVNEKSYVPFYVKTPVNWRFKRKMVYKIDYNIN